MGSVAVVEDGILVRNGTYFSHQVRVLISDSKALWCNGNTLHFECRVFGSNPNGAVILNEEMNMVIIVAIFVGFLVGIFPGVFVMEWTVMFLLEHKKLRKELSVTRKLVEDLSFRLWSLVTAGEEMKEEDWGELGIRMNELGFDTDDIFTY